MQRDRDHAQDIAGLDQDPVTILQAQVKQNRRQKAQHGEPDRNRYVRERAGGIIRGEHEQRRKVPREG